MNSFSDFDDLDDLSRYDEPAEKHQSYQEYENSLTDTQFKDRYRMSKRTFNAIFSLLQGLPRKRGNFFDAQFELLVLLRYLATGSFMLISGELLGISKTSSHSSVHKMMKFICELAPRFVKFRESLNLVKARFEAKFGFPGVIGAIDCTHVKIENPGGDNAESYRNRKGFFSLNVQAVCDSRHYFVDAVVRWPGSTHDSRIFENSSIYQRLSDRELHGHLLGDGGYGLQSFCLVPFGNPHTVPQKRYNKAHSQTRMAIEKAFGILKRRFPALKHGLRLRKTENNCLLTLCAMVLHNICILNDDEIPEIDEIEESDMTDNNEAEVSKLDMRVLQLT